MLSLDTLDASGNRGTDVLRGGDINIQKYRLDSQGERLDAEEYISPALVQVTETPHGVFLSGHSREVILHVEADHVVIYYSFLRTTIFVQCLKIGYFFDSSEAKHVAGAREH